jgi:hypothetical protein
MAGLERLSTQSLWSLVGLISRNAEKLGLQRDGELMGLSPYETEDRRRLWWHLQHLDLILVVACRVTSLSMMAAWDTKLPLNIEDEDIQPEMAEPPPERRGLTSMSYCMFTFWVLHKQRNFFASNNDKFELSWQTNKALPTLMKDTLIKQIEDGLNNHFLQFCDPIKPVDTLLQTVARNLISGMRMRGFYPEAYDGQNGALRPEHRDRVIDLSIQALEYTIALHTIPTISRFRWWTQGMFAWHACR